MQKVIFRQRRSPSLDATLDALRATQANQNSLRGVGAARGGDESRYRLQPEFSVACLVSKNMALGPEYRFMRNRLETEGRVAGLGNGLRSGDWKDGFIAWAPSKNVLLTLACADLGVIVPAATASRKQTGCYLSAHVAFSRHVRTTPHQGATMKKTIFSFALAAAGLLLSGASRVQSASKTARPLQASIPQEKMRQDPHVRSLRPA